MAISFVSADGVTYSFGVFYLTFLHYFSEGKGATAWIASILVGVTLCSGQFHVLPETALAISLRNGTAAFSVVAVLP
jgi:hypothetical protein